RGVVVLVDLGPELHLLDHDLGRFALGLLALLLLLVLVALVVHDLAHRRIGVGRYFDEVEVGLPSHLQRCGERLHTELRTVGADEAHLAGSDPVVDPGVLCGYVITWPLVCLVRQPLRAWTRRRRM